MTPPVPAVPQAPKPKFPTWAKIVLGVFAGLCVIGAISNALDGSSDPAPGAQPGSQIPAAETSGEQQTQAPPTTEQPAEPMTVQGRGKQVLRLPATLNGTYLLEYTVHDNAFILKGLDADGQESGWFPWLNLLDFNTDTLTGSTVVEAENVVMVQSDNVDGSWTLTFTKLS